MLIRPQQLIISSACPKTPANPGFTSFDALAARLLSDGFENTFPLYEIGHSLDPAFILSWITLNPVNGYVTPVTPFRYDRLTDSPRAISTGAGTSTTIPVAAPHPIVATDGVTVSNTTTSPKTYRTYNATVLSTTATSITLAVALTFAIGDEVIRNNDFALNAIGPNTVLDTSTFVNVFVDGGLVVNGQWARMTMWNGTYLDPLDRAIQSKWQGSIFHDGTAGNSAFVAAGYFNFSTLNVGIGGIGRFGGTWSRAAVVGSKAAPLFGVGSAVGAPGNGDVVENCWFEALHQGIIVPPAPQELFERTVQIVGPNITPDQSFKVPNLSGSNFFRIFLGQGCIGTSNGGGSGDDRVAVKLTQQHIYFGDKP